MQIKTSVFFFWSEISNLLIVYITNRDIRIKRIEKSPEPTIHDILYVVLKNRFQRGQNVSLKPIRTVHQTIVLN